MNSSTLLFQPNDTALKNLANNVLSKQLNLNRDLLFTSKNGILYHGDCLDLFSQVNTDSIDLIFADPPFNLNKNYGSQTSDHVSSDKY